MDLKEKLRLKKVYSEMPEQQLLDMLSADEHEYQEGAYELLLEEAKRRGIEEELDKIRKNQEEKKRIQLEKPDRFIQIFETYNQADIAFLKSILKANGIKFIVENENYNSIRPLTGVPMKLKVSDSQLEKAKELLKDFKGSQFGQGQVDP